MVVRGSAAKAIERAYREFPTPAQAEHRRTYGLGTGPPLANEEPEVMHLPGGSVISQIMQHPAFETVEALDRVLPEASFFSPTVSPNRPFTFEVLAYEVPAGQDLWFSDYTFAVLRLSGVDPGDFVYAEAGRFSGVMGFDVQVSQKRPSDLRFQLDPRPIPLERPTFTQAAGAFGVPPASADAFDAAAAQSFGSTSGQGSSLLPVRPQVQGPRTGPFTIIVGEGQTVSLSCTLFRPLLSPIAAIEARLAGFTIHTNMSRTLLNRLRPR
jgi:hypothetical protein